MATNVGFKGGFCRQTGNEIVIGKVWRYTSGVLINVSGSATYIIGEEQSDGTMKWYDFNTNTFKASNQTLTTPTGSMTYRSANNGAIGTGLWTASISTLTGFTVGAVYFFLLTHTLTPISSEFFIQYGSAEGDLSVYLFGTGDGYLKTDNIFTQQVADTAQTGDGYAIVHDGTFGNNALLTAIGNVSGGGGSGSGAYAVNILVTSDGSTPILGAVVRISGAQFAINTTNSSGIAAFSLDAGAVTVTITVAGYYFIPVVETLTGAGTITVTMTANPTITPSADPNKSTVYFTARHADLTKASGVSFGFTMVDPKSTTDAWSTSLTQTATSDSNGLVQIALMIGAKFQLIGPDQQTLVFTVGTGTTTALPGQIVDRF